jgi:KipI family sensor histidine kinase inhibitor
MQVSARSFWNWAPLGERGMLVTWHGPKEERALAVRQLVEHIRRLHQPRFEELVPGIASVLFLYDPLRWTPQLVWEQIASVLPQIVQHSSSTPPIIDIPVHYGGNDGPDLLFVANACSLSPAEVIALHTAQLLPVLMLGFMPGFPYIGELPAHLHLARRSTPRTHVPAGSIAIANDQTGIYPNQSPGGWHLLGRTTVQLFDPNRDPPSLFKPGDLVQFISVDET